MTRLAFALGFVLLIGLRVAAQDEASPRLAVISESAGTADASDLLTVELSSNKRIRLLERDQIGKAYRELNLASVVKQPLKLGQILGADGLLILETRESGSKTNLSARLVAVRAGVVLHEWSYPWPLQDLQGWAPLLATRLNHYLPKLTIPKKDAIPISIVNFRSAVQMPGVQEVERELKQLAIERFGRQKEFFVLERERMRQLELEKDLGADESSFWGGSYLLEGVVDPDGYSQGTINVRARLTPPNGASAHQFELRCKRTNLVEVIDALMAQVSQTLKPGSAASPWNARDEANEFLKEATWALKWKAYSEAQFAADSAWALGMRDEACAKIRVLAYATAHEPNRFAHEGMVRPWYDGTAKEREWHLRNMQKLGKRPGTVFSFSSAAYQSLFFLNPQPQPDVDAAIRGLEAWQEMTGSLPQTEPTEGSEWYAVGVEALTAITDVLQYYYLIPESRGSVEEKLAELRSLARSIAERISQSPSVRASYFEMPDNARLKTQANVFRCELQMGSLWQERPEDCVSLYRYLLGSPAFSQFELDWEDRRLQFPRLVAWRDSDRQRIWTVWDQLVAELKGSNSRFLQLQGAKFEDLQPSGVRLEEFTPQFLEYWSLVQAARKDIARPANYTNDPGWTPPLFIRDASYTAARWSAQAAECERVTAEYRRNLEKLVITNSGATRYNLKTEIRWIDETLAEIKRNMKEDQRRADLRAEAAQKAALSSTDLPKNEVAAPANTVFVREFIKVPVEQIPAGPEDKDPSLDYFTRLRNASYNGGRLFLELRYGIDSVQWKPVLGIYTPADRSWEIVRFPRGFNKSWGMPGLLDLVAMIHKDFYCLQVEGDLALQNSVTQRILKYDPKAKTWNRIQLPDLAMAHDPAHIMRLCAIDDHLYATSPEEIIEVLPESKSIRVLASTRRKPQSTALDQLDSLGTPVLYTGPESSLHAVAANNIYKWTGKDWGLELKMELPTPSSYVDVFDNCVQIWTGGMLRVAWVVDRTNPKLELVFPDPTGMPLAARYSPLWKDNKNGAWTSSLGWVGTNLYTLAVHARVNKVNGRDAVIPVDGYHMKLCCYVRGVPNPVEVPLWFDASRGPIPVQEPFPSPLERNPCPIWQCVFDNSLIIGSREFTGFWKVPLSEIQSAVKAQQKK